MINEKLSLTNGSRTGRTVYDRLSEHYNYSNNPNAKSYKEQTFAKHYLSKHTIPGQVTKTKTPDLSFEVLTLESNTLKRKIKEAFLIRSRNPKINEKQELESLKTYMI